MDYVPSQSCSSYCHYAGTKGIIQKSIAEEATL